MVLATSAMLGSAWGLYRYNRMRVWLPYVLTALFFTLLVPAPVPDHPEFLAPAFIVVLFEWIFQEHGRPGVAVRILCMGAIIGAVAGAGFWLLVRFLARRRQAS